MRSTFRCSAGELAAAQSARARRRDLRRYFKGRPKRKKTINYRLLAQLPTLPVEVDVKVLVAVVQDRVLAPAEDPRLDHLVPLAVRKELPRRVDGHEAPHLVEDLGALGPRRHRGDLL